MNRYTGRCRDRLVFDYSSLILSKFNLNHSIPRNGTMHSQTPTNPNLMEVKSCLLYREKEIPAGIDLCSHRLCGPTCNIHLLPQSLSHTQIHSQVLSIFLYLSYTCLHPDGYGPYSCLGGGDHMAKASESMSVLLV